MDNICFLMAGLPPANYEGSFHGCLLSVLPKGLKSSFKKALAVIHANANAKSVHEHKHVTGKQHDSRVTSISGHFPYFGRKKKGGLFTSDALSHPRLSGLSS